MPASGRSMPVDARPMALAIGTMAACALPLFFTSSLALSIQRDLGLADEQIGIAITTFWVVATAGSFAGGRLVDRIGPARGVRLAGALVAVGDLGIATVAGSYATFVALLGLTALGNALVTPAMSGVVSGGLTPGRRGTTFGLQQSGPPLASVIAGIALPTIGAALGWRWVFALGAVAVVGVIAGMRAGDASVLPRGLRPTTPRTEPPGSPAAAGRRRGAGVLAIAGATIASGVANGLIAYLVVFAVEAGLSTAAAGVLLAVASIACVTTRVGLGVLADRRPRPHPGQMAALVLAGAAGFALLSAAAPWTTVLGCLLALGIGWGWAGLYVLSAVEQAPGAPGRAVGAAATGTFAGAMVGPVLIGVLADGTSFTAAWLVCAALSVAGAAAFAAARPARSPA